MKDGMQWILRRDQTIEGYCTLEGKYRHRLICGVVDPERQACTPEINGSKHGKKITAALVKWTERISGARQSRRQGNQHYPSSIHSGSAYANGARPRRQIRGTDCRCCRTVWAKPCVCCLCKGRRCAVRIVLPGQIVAADDDMKRSKAACWI